MKIQEKFKRLVRLLFSAVLVTVVSGIYGYTWINYFNTIIRLPFFRRGNWMMIFLYIVILFFMMKMYGGFTVGLQEKGKLIFSQLLSVVFTNTFTYFQISVLAKKVFQSIFYHRNNNCTDYNHNNMESYLSKDIYTYISA